MPAPAVPIAVLFDMETSDPDDALTLCLLATHPWARLAAVTVTPGTRAQLGVVRTLLTRLGRADVPVGARDVNHAKDAVSGFHHDWLGPVGDAEPDGVAHEVLASALARAPDAVLLTGAPLQNLRLLLEHHPEVHLARWVAQGGYAGDPVVPPEHRLAKFAGKSTCATFNFNGDSKGALRALASERIATRDLVSKNVCHALPYDVAMHARLLPHRDAHAGLAAVCEAMDLYLRKHPEGKLLHDPLAAMIALRREIGAFREVAVYREKGDWGARLEAGTRTFITVAADHAMFERALIGSE